VVGIIFEDTTHLHEKCFLATTESLIFIDWHAIDGRRFSCGWVVFSEIVLF